MWTEITWSYQQKLTVDGETIIIVSGGNKTPFWNLQELIVTLR